MIALWPVCDDFKHCVDVRGPLGQDYERQHLQLVNPGDFCPLEARTHQKEVGQEAARRIRYFWTYSRCACR